MKHANLRIRSAALSIDRDCEADILCDEVGRVSAPAKKLLARRHRLLHVAEIPPLSEAMDYLEEVDACCLLFLLRLLGYEGLFHHSKWGADPTTVSAVLGKGTS